VSKKLNAKKFITQLHDLEKLIAENDPEAVNLLAEIGTIQGLERPVNKLKKTLSEYDFDKSLELLEQLRLEFNSIG